MTDAIHQKQGAESSLIGAGTLFARQMTMLAAGFAQAVISSPKYIVGRGHEVPQDIRNAASTAQTVFNEGVQAGAAVSAWARASGTPLKYPAAVTDAAAADAMKAIGAGALNHVRMFADLLGLFNEGPTALVLGDVKAQVKRSVADVKLKAGLPVGAGDAANMLKAINGINASRLYPRAYEFIYDHIRAQASQGALETLKGHSIYAPTDALIALSRSFDKAQIPHTVAVLEEAARQPEKQKGLSGRLKTAMREDGPGAYEHFSAKAWELIGTVAVKDTTPFLKDAIASIPQCEDYIKATAGSTANYFDTLVHAPVFLRALIYISEANDKGHYLDGAHVAFPPAASKHAGDILDGYLKTVLGDAAMVHPFFSANRAAEEAKHPIDAQQEYARRAKAAPAP